MSLEALLAEGLIANVHPHPPPRTRSERINRSSESSAQSLDRLLDQGLITSIRPYRPPTTRSSRSNRLSERRLIEEGIISSVHSEESTSSQSSTSTQSSISSQSSRPPPCNATNKLLTQGLLIEEPLVPSRTSRRSSRRLRGLSSASTLVPDTMDRQPSSSSSKWYNNRRLSFSSRSKKTQDTNHYPDPEQPRRQGQSPQEIFEAGLSKNFDLRRLSGLQTIRSAPKRGL